jgi:iron complex outermembrane recepter protein
MNRKLLYFGFLVLSYLGASAQTRQVTGTIKETDGGTLTGVNVVVKGTSTGTATDANGKFTLDVPTSSTTLVISFIGYTTQEVVIPTSNYMEVTLETSADQLEEVIITVGRGSQRTLTDTPLPVDNLAATELRATGQVSFDKALQYRVPSFNTVNTPVNDATSLFDPYEIRNLGPSRTLILINGKRKNLTSLVYTQSGPGRGETGADLSAIPTDAIKRVEILRDGASAQYGSDAIAGVMNIILKDKYDGTSITVNTGSTLKYGGFMTGINYNSGANIGKDGYINFNLSFSKQEFTNRKSKVDIKGEADSIAGFNVNSGGYILGNGNVDRAALNADYAAIRSDIQSYLARFPDGNNKNGQAGNTSVKFLVNTAIPLTDNTEFYANAAYVYRKTNSFANFRVPYWRVDYGLLHPANSTGPDYTGTGNYPGYIGYQPSFDGDLNDYNATVGIRSKDISGWKQDMSLTVGGNKMLFTVDNTVNHDLDTLSPISFKPGGFNFAHVVGNLDFSKALRDNIFIAIGSEFRSETWQLIAGDTASYSGEGANSFPGFQERNAIKATRYNVGAYVDLTWDITDNFLIGGAFRLENYSDFGSASVYKITSRYKVNDALTIRGSISSGFRAPTLHQQFLSLSQASFENGDIVITGLANNFSREARLLGVPKLKAEKSNNVSFGFGFNPSRNFSFTADFYSINIKDRIIYGREVSNAVVNRISFFVNAAETKTTGLDVVASYRNISLGSAVLGLNLAGNYTIENELVGGYQAVNNRVGLDVYNKTSEALLTTSRPKYKFILGGDITKGKFSININNTLFGPTEFRNADLYDSEGLSVQFDPRVTTDLGVNYNLTSKATISVTIQNIFAVVPQYKLVALNDAGEDVVNDPVEKRRQENILTFNGRYPLTTYDGSQFSQMGTMFQAQLNYRF